MTLSTYVYVKDPVDHREVFDLCNRLIGAPEDVKWDDRRDAARWKDGEAVYEPGGPWTISNHPMQGLSAWLLVSYRPDGPLTTPEAAATHDEYCELEGEDACDGDHFDRACCLKVNFDTSYGYSGPDGGCGDLHARLVAELGAWLDERKVRWEWRNEFTGEVHQGYEGLDRLGSGGAAATDWFRNIAAPAILASGGIIQGGQ